jgi:hypothetical protein
MVLCDGHDHFRCSFQEPAQDTKYYVLRFNIIVGKGAGLCNMPNQVINHVREIENCMWYFFWHQSFSYSLTETLVT